MWSTPVQSRRVRMHFIHFLNFSFFLTSIFNFGVYCVKRKNEENCNGDNVPKRIRPSSAARPTITLPEVKVIERPQGVFITASPCDFCYLKLEPAEELIIHRCGCEKFYHYKCLLNHFRVNHVPRLVCSSCGVENTLKFILESYLEKYTRANPFEGIIKNGAKAFSSILFLEKIFELKAELKSFKVSSDQKIVTVEIEWANEIFQLNFGDQLCSFNLIENFLIFCASRGHLDTLKLLISTTGIDPNTRSKAMTTALHSAIKKGHNFIAEYLLENGADVNSVGKNGKSLLKKASEAGNLDVLKILIKYKSKLSELPAIIKEIIDKDDLNTFKFFFSNLNLSALKIDEESTALTYAALKSPSMLKFILQHPVNDPKDLLSTCYYLAVKNDRHDLLKVFEEYKTFDLEEKFLTEILFLALQRKDVVAFEKFLKMGANPDAADGQHSILNKALSMNLDTIALILLTFNAKVNYNGIFDSIKSDNQKSVEYWSKNMLLFLVILIKSENLEAITHFLSRSVKPLKFDGSSHSFYHACALIGDNSGIVRFLIDHGIDFYKGVMDDLAYKKIIRDYPNLASKLSGSDSPAVTALIYSRIQILEVLLENGLNPNIPIFNGSSTLLHLACDLKNIQIARLLIKYGADTRALNREGRTAFSYVQDQEVLGKLNNMDEFL